MRFVETTERIDPCQQIVGDAMHDLANIAMHIGVQAAEVCHARGRSHAAEKAVTLDQKRLAPKSAGRGGRGDAGRATAEDDDLEFAENRRVARRLGDARQDGISPGLS